MLYRRRPRRVTLTGQLISGALDVLAMLCGAVSSALRAAGRAAAQVVSPLPRYARLSVLFALAALVLLFLAVFGAVAFLAAAEFESKHIEILREAGMLKMLAGVGFWALIVAAVQVIAAVIAFFRKKFALIALRIAAGLFAAFWIYYLIVLFRIPSVLYEMAPELFTREDRNAFCLVEVIVWLPAALLAGGLLLCLWMRAVKEFYLRAPARELIGDRVLRGLSTQGQDGPFRSSVYWAGFLHVFVICLLPLAFLLFRGCGEDSYGIPQGSGAEMVQVIEVKRIKKPKDRFVLNMNSPIIFHHPDIEDSRILEQLEKDTLDTYVASSLKMGKTGAGRTGGWPKGMKDAVVRFIRLEYDGGDWDQDMGKEADYNFLLQFHKLTGFKIAKRIEHIKIRRLRKFRKHRAPPFVFITGRGGIGVTRSDVKTLRWYCLEEGGMIFVDNGGGNFDLNFRNLMRRVFPDLQWVDIPNDDFIYRYPYLFANGAPPLWHHSGYRAMGLKHNGRWIVFYHPGDINDAWKTGHSGISKSIAMSAYKLGVNVVYYAFSQYYARHYEN